MMYRNVCQLAFIGTPGNVLGHGFQELCCFNMFVKQGMSVYQRLSRK